MPNADARPDSESPTRVGDTSLGPWGPEGGTVRGPAPQTGRTVHARLRTLLLSPALRLASRILLISVLVLITWGSLEPRPAMPTVEGADKVLHFVAYATVAGLTLMSGWTRALGAFAFAVAFGVLMEIGQHILPTGRTASLADGVANTLGAGLGTLAALLLTLGGRRR